MNKFLLLLLFLNLTCENNNVKVVADLSKTLNEVSGIETNNASNLIWMLNDGGNAPKLIATSHEGKIKKELKIKAKNNDWEDLTSDESGNLYIGDFGNNLNKRKNLAVLKVNASDLNNEKSIAIERISFQYENQEKFPPKKKKMHFDCEAFFYFNNYLYLFTKSRVKGDFGKTNLYKIPAEKGNHIAKLIGTFNSCVDTDCWITAADISADGKKIALLTSKSVWLFTDFENDNFLEGNAIEYDLGFSSQKESLCFKNENSLYIADEKSHGNGGNLYVFSLN